MYVLTGAWPCTASSSDTSETFDLVTPPSRVYHDVTVLHKLRPATPAQLCQSHCSFVKSNVM